MSDAATVVKTLILFIDLLDRVTKKKFDSDEERDAYIEAREKVRALILEEARSHTTSSNDHNDLGPITTTLDPPTTAPNPLSAGDELGNAVFGEDKDDLVKD